MTSVTCRLTAKNHDQLWNPTLGNRVWATFTFFCSGQMPDWTVLWIVHYDTDHLVSEQYTNTYKKCGFLKKQYFICIKKVNESCQALFDVLYVWYQLINDR